MACTNPQNPTCPNCNKSGLAILPARYAVVPMDIDAAVPSPMGNKVTSVKLNHHKYALRALRAGFLYVFHEKHPRGSHIKWEVYGVSEAGTLWKMPSASAIKAVLEEPQCSRNGHNLSASVITIESPEKCKRVWIAFSEHIWSAETLADFEKDAKLRDRRMQTFLPATWVTAGGYRHGLPAIKANIEQILEYKPGFRADSLNQKAVPKISRPARNGSYFADVLKKQSTLYTAIERSGQSEPVAKLMAEIGKNSKGKDYLPLVMGVWDAVGIVHELNGFRNDVVGCSEKYMEELQMEVSAMMAIDGLKEVLGQRAADAQDSFQQDMKSHNMPQPDTSGRRKYASTLPPAEQAKANEISDFIDELKQKQVPTVVIQPTYLDHVNTMPEPQRSVELAKLRKQADDFVRTRDRNATSNIEGARTSAWSKYEKKLDKKRYTEFKKNYAAFQDDITKIANDRTGDLVSWLEAKNLIDAFTEFHGKSVSDGVVFDDQVGRAIFGMNHSNVGQDKIAAWVKEMKTTETNLLWRAMALNQIDAMPELDAYLQEAKQNNEKKILASTVDWIAIGQKSLKTLADTYKKAIGIYNANTNAASEKGSMAFNVRVKPIKTFGIDLKIMTVGDAIMRNFKLASTLDYFGEKMVQHMLSVRALVNPLDSLQLIQAQAKNDGVIRQQTIERLRTARAFLASDQPAMRNAQTESMRRAWEDFKKSEKAPTAIKDVRVALLVMIIEGVNFSKMAHACIEKGDAKSWWGLVASGMTITSGLFDVAGGILKNMTQNAKGEFDKGASLWSYQRLKLFGGVLSSATAAIGVVLDIKDTFKNYDEGQIKIATLYGVKAFLGGLSAALSFATALTYSTPFFKQLVTRSAVALSARVASSVGMEVVAARILLMSAGAWASLAVFTVQVLIWIFSDDELQIWCALSFFGENNMEPGAYRSLREQNDGLNRALIGIGLA
ncbi:Fis family transcriptional regulator [Herbaspirillum sp. DW155]|uniref:T6SS effector BTH_I2691 family protein n=1 Tax=Herbaspirillum sp. DW155 TaxID=3095609 RepID=UPI003091EFD8|nr:Fis family transcriptional regulator [Herbaspirillum sp. DW155]